MFSPPIKLCSTYTHLRAVALPLPHSSAEWEGEGAMCQRTHISTLLGGRLFVLDLWKPLGTLTSQLILGVSCLQ